MVANKKKLVLVMSSHLPAPSPPIFGHQTGLEQCLEPSSPAGTQISHFLGAGGDAKSGAHAELRGGRLGFMERDGSRSEPRVG